MKNSKIGHDETGTLWHIHFYMFQLAENIILNKFSHMLKVALETARIILIFLAVVGRDGTLVINWMTPSISESVVATIAIDTILVTLEKFRNKLENTEEKPTANVTESDETEI